MSANGSTEDTIQESCNSLYNSMLKAFMKRKKVMILAGAGISFSAGIPSLEKMYEDFCQGIGIEKEFNANTADEFPKLTEKYPKEWIYVCQDLLEKINKADSTDAHKVIARLCKERHINYIFSLNYDNLFEKAFSKKDYENIRIPDDLKRFLKTPSSKTALIKAHGDMWMLQCDEGHLTPLPISISTPSYYGDARCSTCGKPAQPSILIPDSAKTASEIFQKILDEKKAEFDLVISIGYSGRWDNHIKEMLRKFNDSGAMIYGIAPSPQDWSWVKWIPSTADKVFEILSAFEAVPQSIFKIETSS